MKNSSPPLGSHLSKAKPSTSERILVLDSLRGIAALSTFFFHFRQQSFFPDSLRGLFGSGFGTAMSFVISGYIIPYVLWKSEYRLNDAGRFLGKRIVRIEPLYLLAIGIVLTAAWVNTLSPAYSGPAFSIDWPRLAANLTYVNAFTERPWYVHVGWILAVELQYYIVIALSFGIISSTKPIQRLLGWFAFLIAPLFWPKLLHSQFALLPGYSYYFAFGILAFQYQVKLIQKTEFLVLLSLMCGFIGLSYSPSAVVVGLVVILPVLFNGMREPATAFIGRMSYSVFLFHMPIGFQVAPRLVKILGPNNPAVFFLTVGIVLVCCWVLHHVAELPLQRLAQRVRYGKYRRREAPAKTPSESVGKRISRSFEALKLQVNDPAAVNPLASAGPDFNSQNHPPKR
jgi:peptidoglycan/LPS O-acetylase OafA/YrhL